MQLSRDQRKLLLCNKYNRLIARHFNIYSIKHEKNQQNKEVSLKIEQWLFVREGEPQPVFTENLDYYINYSESRDVISTHDYLPVVTIPKSLWSRIKTSNSAKNTGIRQIKLEQRKKTKKDHKAPKKRPSKT